MLRSPVLWGFGEPDAEPPALMFAVKVLGAILPFPQRRSAGDCVRTAGGRTRRRRLNKLSCAGWLPHDRRFVSGLPRSSDERRSADRLITGQEGSLPRPCLRQCARSDDWRGLFFLFSLIDCYCGWPCGVVGTSQRRPSALFARAPGTPRGMAMCWPMPRENTSRSNGRRSPSPPTGRIAPTASSPSAAGKSHAPNRSPERLSRERRLGPGE